MAVILPFPMALPWPERTTDLSASERLVLHACRDWLVAVRADADPAAALRPPLAMHGIPDAALSVDALLGVVARAARRPIDLRCPRCEKLSEDEARLLHAAALAQRGQPEMAEDILRALLTDVGASFALGPLSGLGVLLGTAGLRLRARRLPEASGGTTAERFEAWSPPDGPLH